MEFQKEVWGRSLPPRTSSLPGKIVLKYKTIRGPPLSGGPVDQPPTTATGIQILLERDIGANLEAVVRREGENVWRELSRGPGRC